LPKYRGFAPVNWVVINGETETGVTLFYLSEEVDSGDIIAQKKIKIGKNDTAHEVYKKAAELSILLLKKYHDLILEGRAPRKKQNHKKATYGCPRTPEDSKINWQNSNESIHNLIRGLSYPYPGAFCYYKKKKIIIQKSSIPTQKRWIGNVPGRIIRVVPEGFIEVLCGVGSIVIEEIEVGGRRIKPAEKCKSIKEELE
jgi:methionyl-tRNA formyltransferase